MGVVVCLTRTEASDIGFDDAMIINSHVVGSSLYCGSGIDLRPYYLKTLNALSNEEYQSFKTLIQQSSSGASSSPCSASSSAVLPSDFDTTVAVGLSGVGFGAVLSAYMLGRGFGVILNAVRSGRD